VQRVVGIQTAIDFSRHKL